MGNARVCCKKTWGIGVRVGGEMSQRQRKVEGRKERKRKTVCNFSCVKDTLKHFKKLLQRAL